MIQKILIFLVAVLIILVTLFILYECYKLRYKVRGITQLLQASAWNLVRDMENNPTFTAKRYRNSLKRDFEEVIVDSLKQLQPQPASVAIGVLPAPVTSMPGALETIEENKKFTKDFWFVAQGLRNGLQAFIALFILDNPKAAYLKMIEHMKRQRNEFAQRETMKSPNFSELKMILGLPTEWPQGELPEQLERKELSLASIWLIRYAVKHHRSEVFRGLTYKPYTFSGEDEGQEFFGEDVLIGMREYIR
jgi:hypothetical protein